MTKSRETKNRIIRIKLVDGTTINGQININKENGYDRLSDLIGSSLETFLILNSATAYHLDLDDPVKHRTIFVNKRHILWAIPEDDQK